MKHLRWDLIGVALGGVAVAITLFVYMDGKVATLRGDIGDLKLFIDQAFHEAALDRATAADDLNWRLGFYTAIRREEERDERDARRRAAEDSLVLP